MDSQDVQAVRAALADPTWHSLSSIETLDRLRTGYSQGLSSQESRAEEALAALQKMTAPEAQVIRAGRQITVPARELVPGDIVLLETGNYVPADVRLIEAVNLKIDEASLTGESVPVQKRADIVLDREIPLGDRKNTAYMGTVVTYGRGRGVVVSTGMHTQIGLIAEMDPELRDRADPVAAEAGPPGPHSRDRGAVRLWPGVRDRRPPSRVKPPSDVTLLEAVLEMFIVAVSLAIAAVPEGLPAVVTICLALGMQRMIQRHALLRRLPAVEALGSATAICSDKTGTLTQNAMTVTQIWADNTLLTITGEGYVPEGEFRDDSRTVEAARYPGASLLLRAGLLCNDAYIETSGLEGGRRTWRMVGDPTEGALVVAAAKAGY
jgi:Ca2+-transporting ATPase